MKKIKKVIIIMLAIVIVWLAFFIVDHLRATNEQKPIFTINSIMYDDGGSVKYTGLFYNVYKVCIFEDDYETRNFSWHVVPWFYSLDRIKKEIITS